MPLVCHRLSRGFLADKDSGHSHFILSDFRRLDCMILHAHQSQYHRFSWESGLFSGFFLVIFGTLNREELISDDGVFAQ